MEFKTWFDKYQLKLQIITPNISEQIHIVEYINQRTKEIDDLKLLRTKENRHPKRIQTIPYIRSNNR